MPVDDHPTSLEGRIAWSVLMLLQNDADVTRRLKTLDVFEHEELFEHHSKIQLPALAVILDSMRLDATQSPLLQWTGVLLVLLHRPAERPGGIWMRPNLIGRIFEVLYQENGVLRDPEDANRCLTEALTRFDRIGFMGRLEPSGFLATALRVEFASNWNEARREIL